MFESGMEPRGLWLCRRKAASSSNHDSKRPLPAFRCTSVMTAKKRSLGCWNKPVPFLGCFLALTRSLLVSASMTESLRDDGLRSCSLSVASELALRIGFFALMASRILAAASPASVGAMPCSSTWCFAGLCQWATMAAASCCACSFCSAGDLWSASESEGSSSVDAEEEHLLKRSSPLGLPCNFLVGLLGEKTPDKPPRMGAE
mmetsp:Transcript_82661/g.261078  ORF Transcript_82661/g.261078 Transcript_82661/m.261078 type:complete len:203 (-) Transcript_82661:855-1463(-)